MNLLIFQYIILHLLFEISDKESWKRSIGNIYNTFLVLIFCDIFSLISFPYMLTITFWKAQLLSIRKKLRQSRWNCLNVLNQPSKTFSKYTASNLVFYLNFSPKYVSKRHFCFSMQKIKTQMCDLSIYFKQNSFWKPIILHKGRKTTFLKRVVW